MVGLLAFSPDLPVENLRPKVIGLDGEAFDQEGSALVIETTALTKKATQGFPAPLPGEDMTRSLPRRGSGGGYHCGACVMSDSASTAGMRTQDAAVSGLGMDGAQRNINFCSS